MKDGHPIPETAPLHPRESERLDALWRLDVLDTAEEQAFDDLTALAAQICDVPVALVSLVDAERQWFKSHHGVDISETDLERSVCAHAILGDDVLVIEDCATDPRTALNPLVTSEMGMRFYAGAPLIGVDGLPYGSLCVIDTVPRSLTGVQVEALKRLARQAVRLLEARITIRERSEALAQAETLKAEIDHRVANSLQQVAVLLRLQSRNVAHDEAAEAISTAQLRIESISSFHRTISALSDGRSVDVADLLSSLSDDLVDVLPPGVTIERDLPPVRMAARFALPLALILNEFVANSQKYAFPDGRSGVIRLTGASDDKTVRLVFADDGIGWKGEAPESQSTGIGMRVIEASVGTLSGEMKLTGEGGCRLSLSFPLSAVTEG